MEFSTFFFRLAAVIYLAVGMGMLLNKSFYKKIVEDFIKDHAASYVAGLFTLFLGFFLVYFHNIWDYSWEVIVTLFGWAALIKGVMILAFPEFTMKASAKFTKIKNPEIFGFIALIAGMLFVYIGFLA